MCSRTWKLQYGTLREGGEGALRAQQKGASRVERRRGKCFESAEEQHFRARSPAEAGT